MVEYDLSVNFAGLHLKNPIIADSAGYAISPPGIRRLLKAGYAAVITKSCTYDPLPSWPRRWDKSPIPRCYWDDLKLPWESSGTMDGSEALVNPGFKKMAEYIKEVKPLAEELHAYVIPSFSPRSKEEAAEIASYYEKAGATAIHMDLVCSTASRFRGAQLPGKGYDHVGMWWSTGGPERVTDAIKAAKDAVDIPIIPKCYYARWAREKPESIKTIEEVTRVDALSIMASSRIPGTARIDIFRGRPYTYPMPASLESIVPIIIGDTLALAKAAKKPILAAGGISKGRDVIQAIMAGATAVGICRAIYRDVNVIQRICEELESYMAHQTLESLNEIRGVATRYPVSAPDGLAVEYGEQEVPL